MYLSLGMLLVFPLCGVDESFLEQGYHVPKPLISIHGKHMIYHMVDALCLAAEDQVLCICPYSFKNFDLVHPKIQFVYLLEPTKGALHTCLKGLQLYGGNPSKKESLVLMDGDMLYTMDIVTALKNALVKEEKELDCAVSCFHDASTRKDYSFVALDPEGKVTAIAEKERISDYAVAGCYLFRDGELFLHHAHHVCLDPLYVVHGKYYMSSVIRYMLQHQYTCGSILLEASHMVSCRSPNQLCHSLKAIPHGDRTMRFCFDLDGTLVTAPLTAGDYRTVQPILRNIQYVRYLKSLGHTIIIHTARRMKTHQGNVGGVIRDIGKLTLESLEMMDIPYDEIYFGKPYADFYIDDKAVPAYSQVQKMTGLYEWYNKTECRSFNSIQMGADGTITKKSSCVEKLDAEIYYYQHLPEAVASMFPKMQAFLPGHHYTLEYIDSPTASILYVTESLSPLQCMQLLIQVASLHAIVPSGDETEITSDELWDYYLEKLEERTRGLESVYPQIEPMLAKCRVFLHEQKQTSSERIVMIHGDPVFTNILCKEDACMFIDMRGTFAKKKTIYGHALYDYAKIYQSLIGYDEILHASTISHYYKDTLLQIFWNHVPKGIEPILKKMTLYLLLTLLSLHEKRVADECYQLAQELFYSI